MGPGHSGGKKRERRVIGDRINTIKWTTDIGRETKGRYRYVRKRW